MFGIYLLLSRCATFSAIFYFDVKETNDITSNQRTQSNEKITKKKFVWNDTSRFVFKFIKILCDGEFVIGLVSFIILYLKMKALDLSLAPLHYF